MNFPISDLTIKLKTILSSLSLTLPEHTQEKYIRYLELLSRWNQVYNLTAIRDPQEMLIKHIADSLSVAPYIHGERLIDVGTGAGLPGIVLALLFPHQKWTLLDSNGKKTRFLLQVKTTLALDNVEIVHSRVEDYFLTECFDGVIARAWTALPDIVSATKHLCCPQGKIWAMKGKYPEEELGKVQYPVEVFPLEVPGLNEARHLVCVVNVGATPCGRPKKS